MVCLSEVNQINSLPHPVCCQTENLEKQRCLSRTDKVLILAEKLSLVAIGVFSAMISLPLFTTSFAIGLSIGLWEGRKFTSHSHKDHSVCAHGFIEHLTGVKLPAPLSLAANVAILFAHIDHHAPVFIPIVGVSMGIRAASLF